MKSCDQSDSAKKAWFNGGTLWGETVHPSIFCGPLCVGLGVRNSLPFLCFKKNLNSYF